jgi:serine/threonine protein phosphatase PrpC
MEPIASGVEEAVSLANARGGKDNITALIVAIGD